MADNAAQSIKDLSKEVENLDQRIAESIKLLQGFDKGIADLFKEAREVGMANTDQLVDYLAKKLNNLQIKTVVSPFLSAFDEKEIDKAAKRYAALLEKQDVVEKARSLAVGGRKFGELQGEDLKNWREFSALLTTINEQKRQIEQATPGSAEAGQKLYNEQLAFQKAQEKQSQERKRIAQEEAEVKRKAAEDERELNELIAEEERKKTEAAKQKYKEALEANKALTKAEDDLAKSRREQRTAESKAAYKDYFSKQLNAQKQADRESMNIQRRQIQIKAEMAAIDKKRATEGKQLTSEEKARYREISAELTKLIARQKDLDAISQGSGKRARGRLAKYEITEAEKAMRRYGNAVQDARNKQQGLNNETSKMLPTLQRLASAFGVAFSVRGLAQFGKKLIETRGEFEMQFVAMKQIIGDVDAATKIWNQTMQQALQSPFKAMQLVTYTKQLAAYRIETEKLFDTTKRLADISAGLGVDMQRLILAYGQVKAANFLRASEIRQFTEAGVNVLGELSKYFTEIEGRAVSTAQVMERVTKRMVRFEDVEAIFKRMTDEGGQFFEMQEVQADTVKGQLNKLHDAYDQMLNTIGQANQGTIRKFVEILNNMVRNWRDIVPLIKSSVAILGAYVAVTKLARLGTQKYGDAIVRLRLGKKKQTVEMEASLVKETLLLNRQAKTITAWQYQTQKAIFNVKMAWKALGGIFKSFAPFLAIEGALYAFNKIMEPIREARRLSEDLANIRVENKSRADEEVNNYDKLIRRFNELNRGSIERKEIIDKLNSQYGKYIGFQVSETTTLNDLADAQERVNLNIREKARLRAEEEAQQRIAEDYMRRESKLLNPTQAWGVKDVYTFLYNDASMLSGKNTMWLANVEKFAEYAQTKIHDLTDEELKSRQELVNATGEWLNTFYGVSGATEISKGLVDLVELYAEQEQKLRDERKQISEDLKGLPLQVQEDILAMQSQVATAMQKLTKADVGEKVEIPLLDNMRIVVPPDLAEKSGVWEVIKQEINKRQEDFKIKLKLDAGAITEDQAEELRKQAQTTGDIFVDAVNKEISEGILKGAGIEGTFDELKKQIIDYPEMISDWDKVNAAIELINSNLITASDITNGLTNYTKILSENLGNGREAIDEAVKRQNLLVDGTEEEVKKAQEAVDKAKERYKWLLKIAKLLGLDTKSADEIVEEEGYDLSVGQFRLAAAQSAFMEKFGKASNAYGKQLSQIGVTDNLKEVADAYHKQSDELDGLIKNQEKALENETNLTEEQKENAKTTIENLKEQKSMAEFLAEFFGYVPKKTTTRTTHENASKLISLIKEMRGEYDKLSKSAYGYAKSEEKVRESYKDSVKEILGKAGITNYDFTTNEGMIQALEKVKSYATRLGKDAAAEVQKYIDQLETEIEINAQVRIREDFGKQIEKAFNDYELTLELDKLNISPEAAKNLFPEFDSQTLGELQDAMQEFYEKQGASFDEEDLKAYKQWSDKIDAEILKSRKEKAKEYSKYLEKEYSERAKVEMQYAKDVAFVTANFNGEQQKNILKGIEDKYQKDINELTWKSFKESAFYVEMMDDLSSVPVDYMKIMLDKIEELLAHPETLSPRALKEAINARQKILEAQMDINSISVMRESLKEMRDAATDVGGKTWAQTKKRLDEEQTAQAEKLKGLEEEIRCYEELQGQLKGLEQHDEAVATANRALPEDVISMLENTDIDTLIGQYSDELDSLSVSEDAATSAEKDTNAEIQARIEYLQRIIPLLVDYRTALNERAAYQATDAGGNALFARNGGETSSSVGDTINEYKKEADEVSNRLSSLKKWQKAFKNFSDGMAKWNGAVADAITKVGAMGDAFYDTFDALGGETNALTEGWKEFGDTMVQTITQALTLIPQLVAGFIAAGTSINAAMGLIGLIAEAVQLILVAVGAVAKLHDARYEREIEIQQKKIDDLQRAYDRLEKSIEKAFDTVSYIREYNQEVQNLNEQYEALAKQIDAEKAKKNVDEDKLQDYEDKQQEIIDNLEEIKQQQIEVFGGIGEEGYRDAAQGFVDAWKSAFLETGDGLQGLQDHFDEFLNDWFVKQATMKYMAAKLEPLFTKIDEAVNPNGRQGAEVAWDELKEINELKELLFEEANDEMKKLAGIWGLGGEGSLSGLAAGIQGMTEEQANILEAYWNSVRGYTANIDMNVSRIAQILGAGGDNANPMLAQMTLVAQNTNNIRTLLESVRFNGGEGVGIRVYSY
jgi:hypothetical protein